VGRLLELFFAYERAEIAEFRKAVEQFKTDLPAVLEGLREMIERAHTDNAAFRQASERFLQHAQETINPSLTDVDVREMLIQHILTEEIFSKVFGEDDFHRQNNIAKELYRLEGTFFTGNVKKQMLRTRPVLRGHPGCSRADWQPPGKADVSESHLREFLQGLQPQSSRPAGRRLYAQRNRAVHDRKCRLVVREELRQELD